VADKVATIVLRRPDGPNRFDAAGIEELREVVDRCAVDPEVGVVLIRGEGRFFHVGGDFHTLATAENLPLRITELVGKVNSFVSRLRRIPKPVITAVNSTAAGGGMGLALAGDFCIAAESSSFVMAFTASGLSADSGTTWILPRLVGLRRASLLTLANRRLGAKEALDWGLVSDVVPDAELAESAEQLARTMAGGSINALGATKRLLSQSFDNTLDEQLAEEASTIVATMASEEARLGIARFLASSRDSQHDAAPRQ
ncbi:MAG: enoyl-CoA hydratase/isomerase family protein, partial [Hyphomicrobiales bacterium]